MSYSYLTDSNTTANPNYVPPATSGYNQNEEFDRRTALRVLQDLSSKMRPNLDLYGNKILFIRRNEFEEIRAKYLDRKE